MTELAITDPVHDPTRAPSLFGRFLLRFINDPRDLPFVHLSLAASLVIPPIALLLYWPGAPVFWIAPIYWALNIGVFLDRYILMLHNTSHRPLFKKRYRFLNKYIPWVLGPFFGETPETYFAHHLGMHHPENNLKEDLSSTLRFRRDGLADFLRYFGRFFLFGWFELMAYHLRRGRQRLFLRTLVGELSFWVVVGLLLWVNWQATLVVFALPLLAVRFLMMAGNWGQHAFIDLARPANSYVNSITCINTRYNRRCFNDGYHIGHHVLSSRHWTEMPGDFQANVATYAREGAIVFEGIDFFQVWLYLMLGRYDWLARHYVDLDHHLDPARPPRTPGEIQALLRSRTERERRAALQLSAS